MCMHPFPSCCMHLMAHRKRSVVGGSTGIADAWRGDTFTSLVLISELAEPTQSSARTTVAGPGIIFVSRGLESARVSPESRLGGLLPTCNRSRMEFWQANARSKPQRDSESAQTAQLRAWRRSSGASARKRATQLAPPPCPSALKRPSRLANRTNNHFCASETESGSENYKFA